jgi:hypothetical protein
MDAPIGQGQYADQIEGRRWVSQPRQRTSR